MFSMVYFLLYTSKLHQSVRLSKIKHPSGKSDKALDSIFSDQLAREFNLPLLYSFLNRPANK